MTPAQARRRSIQLARHALRVAAAGDLPRAHRIIARIRDETGSDGLMHALATWCDMLIRNAPEYAPGPVTLRWVDAATGRPRTGNDQIPPDIEWAGQFIAAYAADDPATAAALISTVTPDNVTGRVNAVLDQAILRIQGGPGRQRPQ